MPLSVFYINVFDEEDHYNLVFYMVRNVFLRTEYNMIDRLHRLSSDSQFTHDINTFQLTTWFYCLQKNGLFYKSNVSGIDKQVFTT